jgi:sugar/nucleoside kinase (ribokinase family)/phosphoglycolate phosphatase-like HAD superfamily hydrolase
VANLLDLGVGQVRVVGLVGEDLFGRLMLDILTSRSVNCDGMLRQQADWQTLVYSKPYIGDAEQSRIDFGGFNRIEAASADALVQQLRIAAAISEAIILNQQVLSGVSTPETIRKINAVVAAHPECRFLADSRHRAELYEGCVLKLNAHEAARLLGAARPLDERVPSGDARKLAAQLFGRTGKPVFVTRGENGLIAMDTDGAHEIPGIQIVGRTDPVGCGDTAVAAIAAVLARGGTPRMAATLANIAASITARKLQMTGSATPDEIRQVGPMPDYVYLPELADDLRRARYLDDTEIEVVRDLPETLSIRHAIFDHDGTISTLREGWERIMEPMMVRAILGPRYEDADEALYHKVVDTVRAFIEKTTGVQTLVQMQGLVNLVCQFHCVEEADILDLYGYKRLYNEQLMAMVRRRIGKLQRGELESRDFAIKNAREFLETLHAFGVRLYLASGTDQEDVVAEARAMGYAHLFEGRIFGAVGDVEVEAKKLVIERILREHDLSGPQLATFGDGPVEIRETRKRGGIAVGLASDELRRFGLNPVKRARLIRAGADIVIPDFSQLDRLARLLQLRSETSKKWDPK